MKSILFCLSTIALALAGSGNVTAQSGYKVTAIFHIASPGGWDYPASDPGSNRVYVSHGSQVNILDKTTGDSVGVIPGTTGVHGIAFAAPFGKGYTSNGRLNSVTVFDLKTTAVLRTIEVGKNPDWILYDPFSKKVITSNHSAGSLSFIDPETDIVVATVPVIGTALETVVSDKAGRLYINAEDKNEIAVVDIATAKVIAHWPLPGDGPTGLAIDIRTKRLFTTCDKLLVVLDLTSGKVVAKVPIGNGCDGAAFDPSTGLIFTSNGEGSMTIVKEVSANEFTVLETVATKRGARTITLDENTHRIFLPTAEYEPLATDAPKGTRPKMIPGSFQLLVLDRK